MATEADVERSRRMHRNETENIPMFLAAGKERVESVSRDAASAHDEVWN